MDQYILSLSYGKDSLACLGAIEQLGWPLDRIVHAEVWATDDIPADLPPMVEFKSKADKWIKEHFGIEVEHVFATRERESNSGSPEREKLTYEKIFYRERKLRGGGRSLYGFPMRKGQWCTGYLKQDVLNRSWALQQGGVSTVPDSSNGMLSVGYGVPDKVESVLHRRAQDQSTHGVF